MRYLGRLDDVCSTMDAHKWTAIENILDISGEADGGHSTCQCCD